MDVAKINQMVIQQYRAGGEITGMHRDRLILLTSTGRITGEPRTTPMFFLRDEDSGGILVIGSANAAPDDPDWVRNVEAEPAVRVEAPEETYQGTARVLDGEERNRVWASIVDRAAFFAELQSKVERVIPVVLITRA